MESKIPKLANERRKPPAPATTGYANKPLSELNTDAFAQFKFQRAKSPDIFKPLPTQAKLRRSKSELDLRRHQQQGSGGSIAANNNNRPVSKRFQPKMENIPSKRLKMTAKASSSTARPPLNIKTQEKKKAILSILKPTTAAMTTLKSAVTIVKKPLVKSTSSGASIGSRIAAKSAGTSITDTSKNIAKPRIIPFMARILDLKERFDSIKTNSVDVTEKKTQLETIRSCLVNEIRTLMSANTLSLDLSAKCEDLKTLSEPTSWQEKKKVLLENIQRMKIILKNDFEQTDNKLMLMEDQLYQKNIERRFLHNKVLDLSGNIRVYARVRPPLGSETDRALCGWSFNDESSLEIISNEVAQTVNRKKTKHDFTFDQVFDPRTAQSEIFEIVSPLIQSALDGYNVCIFAYGQTGSGKTFTMDGHDSMPGIIPRTVQLLFDYTKSAEIHGWRYKIKASFLEIYNEVLFDLLAPKRKDLEIKKVDAKSKTDIYVSNLTEEKVTTAERLHELMNIARSNRATAATAGNERSSRSHAVTRLEITGQHDRNPERLVGMINLVDLAGSENPKTSIRMDETKNINRSLSELGNVIRALFQRSEHVQYRNSKLTYLLMPNLGGNSKTLMFVNVSPFQDCFVESVRALTFASEVKSCKMEQAKINRQPRN